MKEERSKPHDRLQFASKMYDVPYKLLCRPDFLQKEFNEARADRIAAKFDLNGLGRLVVNHRDGRYWIIDGCNRHHALGVNGFQNYDIPCEVYEDLTDEQMAKVFLLLANRRVMSAFEKFNVNVEANAPRECEIQRSIEALGLKISRMKHKGCLSSVAALVKIFDLGGSKLVALVLRTLNAAYDGDHTSFDPQIILGLGRVYNRFDGRAQEKLVIDRLVALSNGVRGLHQRAEQLRCRTGNQKAHCISAVIVDLYNKGLTGKDRLPPWWKSADEAAA